MAKSAVVTYIADSLRGTENERVLCVLLESPSNLLDKKANPVLDALSASGLSNAIGLYFYRFANQHSPFIKIGECTRPAGISKRFSNGWHGAKTLTDSYWSKRSGSGFVESAFLGEINEISKENPAYFVFYQHRPISAHPKIDELYAYRQHVRLYKSDTLSPEKMNGNYMVGRRLVWHKRAFSEVARLEFPGGAKYPA